MAQQQESKLEHLLSQGCKLCTLKMMSNSRIPLPPKQYKKLFPVHVQTVKLSFQKIFAQKGTFSSKSLVFGVCQWMKSQSASKMLRL